MDADAVMSECKMRNLGWASWHMTLKTIVGVRSCVAFFQGLLARLIRVALQAFFSVGCFQIRRRLIGMRIMAGQTGHPFVGLITAAKSHLFDMAHDSHF